MLLAGCGSGGAESEEPSAPGGRSDTADVRAGSDTATGSGPAADPSEVAPADLANFACGRRANGRWGAEGIVTNSAGKPMVYTVTVVTVDDSQQVVGERIESFELKPDQTRPFSWRRFYRGAAAGCMPHVEREPA